MLKSSFYVLLALFLVKDSSLLHIVIRLPTKFQLSCLLEGNAGPPRMAWLMEGVAPVPSVAPGCLMEGLGMGHPPGTVSQALH